MRVRVLLVLFCCVCAARAAFTIDPAVVTLQSGVGENAAFVEFLHTGGGPMAIELTIFERHLDIDGDLMKEKLVKSKDFLVHPAEIILYPKEKVSVQVMYKGKGKVTADKAYMLFSKEVPIDVGDDEQGGVRVAITMLTNYYTVLALETGKAGKLVFVSSKAIGDGKIEVIAENKGGGRVPMNRLALVVGGRRIPSFTGGGNSIMPGTQRRFTFEHPKAVTAKEVKFSF